MQQPFPARQGLPTFTSPKQYMGWKLAPFASFSFVYPAPASVSKGAKVLMKGHPVHDAELQRLLEDPHRCCVALWPNPKNAERLLTSAAAVRQRAPATLSLPDDTGAPAQGQTLTLILLEGTWKGAKNMANKLSKTDVWFWRLAAEEVAEGLRTGDERVSTVSLLGRLRKCKPLQEQVCTAQAGVAALRALGWSAEACTGLLRVVETKVQKMCVVRGKKGHVTLVRDGGGVGGSG